MGEPIKYRLLKDVDYSWTFFFFFLSSWFAWLCRLVCFWNVYNFFLHKMQNSKLVYSFESLSLSTRQGSGIVHFTVLAPKHENKKRGTLTYNKHTCLNTTRVIHQMRKSLVRLSEEFTLWYLMPIDFVLITNPSFIFMPNDIKKTLGRTPLTKY